jgi:RNA polymerase sigma factor (sigma-70 family)
VSEEDTFRNLIRRVRMGDQEAAAELVRRYEPSIRRVARVRLMDSRLRRTFDSMDICQSVFASFFVRATLGDYELEKPEQLLNLLLDISRKKLADRARAERAARRDYRRVRGEGGARELPARDPSPSQELVAKDLLQEVRKRLSAEERQLAEHRTQGHDWNQIAAMLGGSPEALRKKLNRAVERVTRDLGLENSRP